MSGYISLSRYTTAAAVCVCVVLPVSCFVLEVVRLCTSTTLTLIHCTFQHQCHKENSIPIHCSW